MKCWKTVSRELNSKAEAEMFICAETEYVCRWACYGMNCMMGYRKCFFLFLFQNLSDSVSHCYCPDIHLHQYSCQIYFLTQVLGVCVCMCCECVGVCVCVKARKQWLWAKSRSAIRQLQWQAFLRPVLLDPPPVHHHHHYSRITKTHTHTQYVLKRGRKCSN